MHVCNVYTVYFIDVYYVCVSKMNANKRQWVAKRVTKSRRRDKTVARTACNSYIVLLLVSYVILFFGLGACNRTARRPAGLTGSS